MFLSHSDLLALLGSLLVWGGYSVVASLPRMDRHSLAYTTEKLRAIWMRRMCDNEMRVADASMMGNLMRSVAFFASSSILVLSGLVALLGGGERSVRDQSGADGLHFHLCVFSVHVVAAAVQLLLHPDRCRTASHGQRRHQRYLCGSCCPAVGFGGAKFQYGAAGLLFCPCHLILVHFAVAVSGLVGDGGVDYLSARI